MVQKMWQKVNNDGVSMIGTPLRGAVCMVVNRDRQVLLMLRDDKPNIAYPAHFCLPGGAVEKGEYLASAAVREVGEEFGPRLEALITPALQHFTTRANPDNGALDSVFIAHVDVGADDVEFGDEGQGFGFYSFEDIQALKVVPYVKTLLDAVLGYNVPQMVKASPLGAITAIDNFDVSAYS